MTLFRLTLDGYDPEHPADEVITVENETGSFGVVLPASNGTIEAFDDRILSNPSQLQQFRFVILAGLGLEFEPGPEDLLATREGIYRVLGSTKLDPSGEGGIIYNIGATMDINYEPPLV